MDDAFAIELREQRSALREQIGRVGCWSFSLEAQTADDEARDVAEIERMGYRAIWFPESVESREVFSHAAWLLGSTERAVIASGIANIWARDPIAMTNGWHMLTDAYPDRFVLGMGVSHPGSVARRGSRYVRPYSHMREYLDTMDRAASSAPEPVARPRRVLAALGPRMLELSAERSLGAHPYFVPVEHTAFARTRLGPEPILAVEQTVVLETDAAEARRIARGFASGYLSSPNYSGNLRRMGYTAEDVSGSGTDRLIDAVIAWGDVDRIASRVREQLAAGADHVCIQVIAADDSDVCLDELRELAPALFEL